MNTIRLSAIVICLGVAGAASGQSATRGIRLGEGTLNPYFEVEGRYDSLAVLFADPTRTSDTDDILLTLQPGLKYSLANDSTSLSFDFNARYSRYLAALTPATSSASFLGTMSSIDLAFNRNRAIEVHISDTLNRTNSTVTTVVGIGALSLSNRALLEIPLRPGGRALEIVPKVAHEFEQLKPQINGGVIGCQIGDPSCDASAINQLNWQSVVPGLGVRWKFLPKTAVILDSGLEFRSYSGASSAPLSLLRAQAGLNGLVSSSFAVTAMAGYAYDLGGLAAGFIGQGELTYFPTQLISAHVGYQRAIVPQSLLTAGNTDRIYAGLKLNTANGRFILGLTGSYNSIGYVAGAGRRDDVYSAELTPQYFVTDWMSTAIGYIYSGRSSTTTLAGLNFDRSEVFGRIRIQY